jgi:hypothetical protein
MNTPTRVVRVRLRPREHAAVVELAASRWRSVERVCEEIVARHLGAGRLVPLGRVPMPPGVDLAIEIDAELWSLAKIVSKSADITIGQLFRHAIENFVRRFPRSATQVAS